jgi:hypothetical protein
MAGTCYEMVDGGKAVGWVVAAEARPQPGPGSATVLLTRPNAAKSAAG